MTVLALICLLAALLCFAVAALGRRTGWPGLVPAGLALLTLALLLQGLDGVELRAD